MTTVYEDQVADALGAVALRPPAAFLWFGRRCEAPDLTAAIAARLLTGFYASGGARPLGPGFTAPGDGGALARALSQANSGRGSWQAGWTVGDAVDDDDTIAVQRPDGLALLAAPQDIRGDEVRVPPELRALRPGSYVALGDAQALPGAELARLSWHLAAAGAVTFVARVTYALNGAGLAFTLELLDDPARYGRRDAATLLLARRDVAPAIKLLRPLLRALGPQLAEGAPAFCKPLARGLAIAEEPAGGEPFGAHRCRLLAEAIVAGGGAAHVRAHLAAAGVSLDAPYLQPGSADAYELS